MKIQYLATMQTRLIGKWIYMEMLSGAKKVFTFLREIFVRQAEREKSLKSCWWFPGEVLVDRRGSFTRVENPGFCCTSHPSPTHCTFSNGQSTIRFILFFLYLEGKVQQCGRSSIQGFSSLECCTMSKIMFWCTEKCTQPIFIADCGLITLHIANQIYYLHWEKRE